MHAGPFGQTVRLGLDVGGAARSDRRHVRVDRNVPSLWRFESRWVLLSSR